MSHKSCYIKREVLAQANKAQAEVISELRAKIDWYGESESVRVTEERKAREAAEARVKDLEQNTRILKSVDGVDPSATQYVDAVLKAVDRAEKAEARCAALEEERDELKERVEIKGRLLVDAENAACGAAIRADGYKWADNQAARESTERQRLHDTPEGATIARLAKSLESKMTELDLAYATITSEVDKRLKACEVRN